MKEHIQAKFTNLLRETAIRYKDCESLRGALSRVVAEFINPVNEELEDLRQKCSDMQLELNRLYQEYDL